MSGNTRLIATTAAAFLAWVAAWGALQFLHLRVGVEPRWLIELFFTGGYAAGLGVALPLWISARFGLSPRPPERRRARLAAGWALHATAALLALVGSGVAAELLTAPPAPVKVLRYVLLFVPMSLGIGLMCFHLLPRVVECVLPPGWPRAVLALLLPCAAIFVGFCADTLLTDLPLAGTMALIVLLVGAAERLIRRLGASCLVLYVIVTLNTLNDAQHDDFNLVVAGAGVVLVGLILLAFRRGPGDERRGLPLRSMQVRAGPLSPPR